MATAYVKHPCSQKQKEKLLKKFDKVLDVRFAPESLGDGDKIIGKESPKSEPKKLVQKIEEKIKLF